MNKEQIYGLFKNLSYSQGYYGRLLEYVNENQDYLDYLESLNFKTDLDLILYLEGC